MLFCVRKGKVQGKVNFPNDSGGLPPRRSCAFLRQHIPSRALTRVKEDLSSDHFRWKNILKGSNDWSKATYFIDIDSRSNKMIPDSRLIPGSVKALVFDCDGTLVDTMPIHWRAWCKICNETGLVFRKKDFYTLAGVPGKKIINVLAKQQGIKLDPCAIYDQKRKYFLEGLTSVTAIQCVVRFAQEAHKLGIPTAVASGSSRAQVQKGKRSISLSLVF